MTKDYKREKNQAIAAQMQRVEELFEEAANLRDDSKSTSKQNAAIEILKFLANGGHIEAQFRLGRCYQQGQGVAENLDKAIEWFEKTKENRTSSKVSYQLRAQNEIDWITRNKLSLFPA